MGFILVVVVIAVIAVICLRIGARPEPSYGGKTLTAWLRDEFAEADLTDHPFEDIVEKGNEASDAVRSIGTNAIPELLVLSADHTSPFTLKLERVAIKLPILKNHITPRWEEKEMAELGFGALGASAKPAVPALVALLSDKNSDVRESAFDDIAAIGPAAEDAIPRVIQYLDNADESDRWHAAGTLGSIGISNLETVLPVITNHLNPTNGFEFRAACLGTIWQIGPAARVALPAVIPNLSDTNAEIRRMAIETIQKIAPEVATNLGLK